MYPVKRLCQITAPLDERLDCVVNIIKRAYSEFPSFDALIDAGLEVPLHDFHKVSSLTPGVPVEPMLAKPAKSV